MYKRAEYQIIKNRLEEPIKFIQVVMGARQIGKSTVVKQVLKDLDLPYLFYSADNVPASNAAWVSDCWEAVRSLERSNNWESAMTKVDFILRKKNSLVAIEVKGNAEKRTEGLDKFRGLFKPTSSFIVGDGGIKAEEFMSIDLMKLF